MFRRLHVNAIPLLVIILFLFSPVVQARGLAVVPVGQPGLSFRYVKTFGETGVPYLVDNTHLNRPAGLFIDPSDNLYVTEDTGLRVLRFNAAGTNTLSMGRARSCWIDSYVFCSPQDVTIDNQGHIWEVDGTRVGEYTSSGVLMQQIPPDDPWNAGSDSTHFNQASGIAFDSNGKLFVADTGNHRIQIYTFDGSGNAVYSATLGVNDVSGKDNTHFNHPLRIAIDSSNDVYVVDQSNQRIQTCHYNTGWSCYTYKSGLLNPQGIAVDHQNAILFTDNNNTIYRCHPPSPCSTWPQLVDGAADVAADSSGNVYVTTQWNDTVVRLSNSGGQPETVIGANRVPYLTDRLHYSEPLAAVDPSGNILIVENSGQRLLKLDPQGNPLWAVGEAGVAGSDNSHFNGPDGVTTDQAGNVYVADTSRVQIFTPGGAYLSTIGGGSGNDPFSDTSGIAVDQNGAIYVSDQGNHRVQIYNSNRVYQATLGVNGVSGADNTHLNSPHGVSVDTAGNIYVADAGNCRVQKFNSSLAYQTTFGTPGDCSGDTFASFDPKSVAVDHQGRLYVGGENNRVQVYDSTGAYLTTLGGDWSDSQFAFRGALGTAIDSQGNVYVSDFRNQRVQKYSPGVPGWKQLNINGFSDRNNQGANALQLFNGSLYAGVANWTDGASVWRTSDGVNWAQVSENGFGEGVNNAAIVDLAVFNGKLYANIGWGNHGLGQIWRTENGTTWEKVVNNGFGDSHNGSVYRFFLYNQMLYASTASSNGAQIWRTATGNANDWNKVWSAVDVNDMGVDSFILYQGYIYGGIENKVAGMKIIRSSNGTDWDIIASGGLGNANNVYIQAFAIFNGDLYLSTQTQEGIPGQIWHSNNGTTWIQAPTSEFSTPDIKGVEGLTAFDGKIFAFVNSNNGEKVMQSPDGSHWMQINPDGFGHSSAQWSFGNSSTIIYQGKLTRAIMNSINGGEIWQWQTAPVVYLPMLQRP